MKNNIKKSLAFKVKALRESAGLTQEDLAAKCNVSWRTISNLERGLVVPDLVMLIEISKTFHTSLDDLLSFHIDSSKSKSRIEREQFIIEKIRTMPSKALDFLFDEIMLIFKHFN
ncbi:MAG: helix-turn-helix transcriptional regulator [Alphaproteobacteria bacterium]|nr:helix-turn-helix transcriptional regulator [Alphaproteobacteria bacterium]